MDNIVSVFVYVCSTNVGTFYTKGVFPWLEYEDTYVGMYNIKCKLDIAHQFPLLNSTYR
jgi:hypothetical protein